MNKKILSLSLVLFEALILAACGSNGERQIDPDWLVEVVDMDGFSNEIGIVYWKLVEEIPGRDSR